MDLDPSVSVSTPAKRRRQLLVEGCTVAIVVIALVVSMVSLAVASNGFPDVPATHPYYAAINDLASRSIINGYGNGDFGPGDPVTRQQFAKMVVLTGGYPVSETNICYFTDVERSDDTSFYPDNYVAVCAANGITVGKTATTFDPYARITRYQVLSMVVRMADNLQAGLLGAPPPGWSAAAGWDTDPTHGSNAATAECNGLLAGLDLPALSPYGDMSRGEVAQVLHNLLGLLTPPTTTTTATSTTTTTEATTTTTSSTSTTSSSTTTSSTTTSTTLASDTGYQSLGGMLTSGPGVCSWAAGRLDVFARGLEGHIWHRWYNGVWHDWQDIGGTPKQGSDPAAVSWGLNRIDMFVRGTDNHLWQKWYNGVWHDWHDLGGNISSGPAAASWASGRLDVFARGSDGHLWWKSYDGIWHDWQPLGGNLKPGSSPAAVSWGSNRIDVFV
ncbi:MAG: S-layer homology domain-containing protein, partial [Thermoleophilia bacterium]|nr:S-layer homology domain-containing protein [Thermoleophilia bacterium]